MSAGWAPAGSVIVPPEALPPQPPLPRVKVLHVITKFWAGAGGNTLLTAIGTDADRYEVWIAGCEGGPLWERAEAAGIRTVRLTGFKETIAPLSDLRVLFQLLGLIRRERFSIVHTHSAKGGFLGRLAAWLCRVPVILYTFHGFSYHEFMSPAKRWAYVHLERIAGSLTDASFAVAPRVAREAVEQRLARPGEVTVAPSAVEVAAIPRSDAEAFRTELGVPEDAPIVGTVGRLDFQKAPLDFVRMAAAVAARRPGARFVMVGDGSLRADAEREAARLGVDVTFTGERNDAPEIAASFDVFVIASLYEGLGRALTEALASSRPVVATAVNGVPDIVEPGVTGLLATPGDPASLASSVLWLLAHPDEAERMGARARDRVRSLFAPERMCSIVQSRYDELIGVPTPEGRPRPMTVSRRRSAPRVPIPNGSAEPPSGAARRSIPQAPAHPREFGDASDARTLNWTFLVPADDASVLLLPTNGERLERAVVADRNVAALRSVLAEGPYPGVAAPDVTGWARLVDAPRSAERLLALLANAVQPGGWLYVGFANANSPFRLLGGAGLSRRRAIGALSEAGFLDLDVYAAFPDHRAPAYLVSSSRDAELDYFVRELAFPHAGETEGWRGALGRHAIAGAYRIARSVPSSVGARFVPSLSVVARRRS